MRGKAQTSLGTVGGGPNNDWSDQVTSWGQQIKGKNRQGGLARAEETAPAEETAAAEETAERTMELLESRGWCLWRCSALGGEVIAVVRGELSETAEVDLMNHLVDAGRTESGSAVDNPVYTEEELYQLFSGDVSEAHLRLVHEAKKMAGAVIVRSGGRQ